MKSKRVAVILAIFISNVLIGQEIPQLKLTRGGVEAIIVEVDGLSTSEIYNKAKSWVQETYKNPDKVLKADIANEKIRINGYANDAWWNKSLGIKSTMDMEYTVEISFKDGKYRFVYNVGQFYVSGAGKAYYSYSSFFKKKNGEVRKAYKDAVPSLEITMNDLSQSFFNYVSGKSSKKDNDW